MKGLKLISPKVIKKIDLDIPQNIPKGHALIKINTISLCGSDYKLFYGNYSGPCRYPLYFGHEWSGEVVEINDDTSNIKIGDKVTGDCSKWCGNCCLCKEDKNLCSNIEKFGITIDGYSRQYAVVETKYLYIAPMETSFDILALTECFSVALHAIKKIESMLDKKDRCILIIGGGAIGLSIYLLLKFKFNYCNIKLMEIDDSKKDFISKMFDVNFTSEKSLEVNNSSYSEISKHCNYDIIFEASGNIEAFQQALYLINPNGHIITLGMYPNKNVTLSPITLKSIKVHGTIGGTHEFDEVIKFLISNKYKVKKMITHTYGLDDASMGFQVKDKRIKTQINLW